MPTPAAVEQSSPRPARSAMLHAWRPYWVTLAVASLAALVLVPSTVHEQPPMPKPGMGGAALAGLAQESLTAPALVPVDRLDSRQAVSLGLPPRPFPGQRLAPCEEGATVEIELSNGAHACWFKVEMSPKACTTRGYEWKGGCYLPHIPSPREPSSTLPPRTGPAPLTRGQ